MADIISKPDYDASWAAWKANPGPEANAAMLEKLDPVITNAIQAHIGKSDPMIRSRARQITLQALNTYQPGKAKLPTHLYGQLQGLKRYVARHAAPLQVPERVSLENMALADATQELTDKFNRDPTEDELSDHLGLSRKRIRYIRKVGMSPLPESFFSQVEDDGDESSGNLPAVKDNRKMWLQAIHDDLESVDQHIMDWSLGGMPNQEIAAKLKISPGRVSQRKAVIQQIVDTELPNLINQ